MSPLRRLARGITMVAMLAVVACELAIDLSPYTARCNATPGTKECPVNGVPTCVPTNDPDDGCARAGCVPCALPNAQSTCGQGGLCAIQVCLSGFIDCDNNPANGCEVNGNTDYHHCGISSVACNTDCDVQLRTVTTSNVVSLKCSSGGCVVDQCNPGFRDCNGSLTDGCEKNILGNTCGGDHMQPCCGLCNGCPTLQTCDMTGPQPKCVNPPPPPDGGSDAAGEAATGGD